MTHRQPRSLVALALALALAATAGCEKEGSSKKLDTTRLQPPGAVDVERAIAAMGTGASNRIVMRAGPLWKAGIAGMIMDAVPAPQRAKYDDFVRKSGIDPAKRLTGVLLYSEGDMEAFDKSDPVMLFGLDGAIGERLIDAIEAMTDDDDKGEGDADDDGDDGDDDRFTMISLVDVPTSVRDKLRALLAEDGDESGKIVIDEAIGDAVLLMQHKHDEFRYMYIWESGVIFRVEKADGSPEAAAIRALTPVIAELTKAASATPAPSNAVLSGHATAQGTSVTFSVMMAEETELQVSFVPPGDDVGKVDKILDALPVIREQPDFAISQAPPPTHQLVRLLLRDLSGTRDGDRIVVRASANTDALKQALRPIIDSFSKP